MDKVDEVLCMSVNPGYGGQSFITEVLPKIKAIREFAVSRGFNDLDILVDGGIELMTAIQCAEHGANVLVSGTALYGSADMKADIQAMRDQAQEHLMPSSE